MNDAEERIQAVEQEIRWLTREYIYVLDTGGNVLFRSQGSERTVFIPEALAHRRLVLHNHPNGESFSRADVRVFLRIGDAEFRLVTDRYRFCLRNAGGVQWDDIERLVGQLYFEEMEAAIDRYRRGSETAGEASRDVLHRVWERAAAVLGWDYRREEFS